MRKFLWEKISPTFKKWFENHWCLEVGSFKFSFTLGSAVRNSFQVPAQHTHACACDWSTFHETNALLLHFLDNDAFCSADFSSPCWLWTTKWISWSIQLLQSLRNLWPSLPYWSSFMNHTKKYFLSPVKKVHDSYHVICLGEPLIHHLEWISKSILAYFSGWSHWRWHFESELLQPILLSTVHELA